ncbi:MAG: DUF6111 family protein [Hyphomicrobium sp.]
MIRIALENVFFFLLPTLCYIAYAAFKRNDWPGLGRVLKEAPLIQLFLLGAGLMIATLAFMSTSSGHKPGVGYTPSTYRDGKLEPGHGSDGKK